MRRFKHNAHWLECLFVRASQAAARLCSSPTICCIQVLSGQAQLVPAVSLGRPHQGCACHPHQPSSPHAHFHLVKSAYSASVCRSAPMDEPFEGPAPALPPPLAPPPPPPGTPRPGGFAGGFESIWSGAAEPCQGMTDWVPGSISAVWGASAPRRPDEFAAQQPTTPRCSSPARRQVSW